MVCSIRLLEKGTKTFLMTIISTPLWRQPHVCGMHSPLDFKTVCTFFTASMLNLFYIFPNVIDKQFQNENLQI